MFHYFKRQTVERSDKVVEEGERKDLQKEKESGNLSGDDQDISSGSMLAIDATMVVSSDPEKNGSEESSEEDFILAPEFVLGHLEHLEEALTCPEVPTAYMTYASDYNSRDDSKGDHSMPPQKQLQKENESAQLSEDNRDISSGSMLAIDAAMVVSSDPEKNGSEESSEEEFILAPEFVPGHLEYLEDALMCPDLPTVYHTYASDYSSSDDSEGDHSNDGYKNHGSSSDQSDNHCHEADGSDVCNNDNVILQKQEMDPGDLHLHILQSKVEYNYTKVVEGNGKSVERKEEQEEEHKESKARSRWKDREDSPSGFTLVDGISMSTLRDPEIGATNEQSFNEDIFDVHDNLLLIPNPALEQSFNEDIFDVHDNLLLIPSPALVERVKPEPYMPDAVHVFAFLAFPVFIEFGNGW
ncbi:uncharacterized protein LOC116422684 [Sarcophilus harrisii]|uniref:uncharacterized protein LOC116422684 n=1 Tax=Sarcophilus harrisii TaxID=9305 RepID=UPI0013019E5E|nr:uncharacterized protein LOC116422684 [Sarcophilus harrisii]